MLYKGVTPGAAFSFILGLLLFIIPSAARAEASPASPLRSFSELFPGISEEQKSAIFSEEGLIRVMERGERLELVPASSSGIDLHSQIVQREHNFLTEIVLVVPHPGEKLDKLDAYNALIPIRGLSGLLFHSHSRQEMVPLFEDATRIESERRTTPIPDPPPATQLPSQETIFVRLRDVNFGNTFYRGEFARSRYGIIYRLTNFRTIRFLLFPVLREENLSATLYMEPINEGMLIYIVAGADVSNFVANRIHIPSAIAKRGEVFLTWVRDALRAIR